MLLLQVGGVLSSPSVSHESERRAVVLLLDEVVLLFHDEAGRPLVGLLHLACSRVAVRPELVLREALLYG